MRYDKILIGAVIFAVLAAMTFTTFQFLNNAVPDARIYYLVLLGAPAGLAMMLMPRATLALLTIWVYSMVWVADTLELMPRESIWMIDIILLVLFIRTLVHLPFCHHPPSLIGRFLPILGLFIIGSALLNGIGRETLVFGVRLAFRYTALFLAIYHMSVTEKWVGRYLKFVFLVGLIQTPVVLIQYFTSSTRQFGDMFGGSFGTSETGGVGMFLLVLLCFMFAQMLEKGKVRLIYVFALVWMAVCPIVGEVKMFFLFLPILLGFMIREEMFKRPGTAIAVTVLGLVFFVAADLVIVKIGGWEEGRDPLTYIQKLPEVFEEDYRQATDISPDESIKYTHRGYQWVNAIRFAAASPKAFFFGIGPGAITVSEVTRANSDVLKYYSSYELSSRLSTSFTWLLIEYGYIGTILFFAMLYMIYRRGRVLRTSTNMTHRIYGRALESMTFVYAAFMFYSQPLQSNTHNLIYWSLAGMLVRLSYSVTPATEHALEAGRAGSEIALA